MIHFPPVFELSMMGVADPGVPNRERIVLRPTQKVNLGHFGLLIASPTDEGGYTPLRDHLLWLDEYRVAPPSWIFVYTGPGSARETEVEETGEDVLTLHWGKKTTLFGETNLRPVLFRLGSVAVGHYLNPPGKKEISAGS